MTYKPGSSPVWKGNWGSGTAYKKNEIVNKNGASWIAPTDLAAGNNPNSSGDGLTPTNGWALFAAKGTTPSVTVNVTAPGSPMPGDVWVNTKGS